MKNCPRTFEIYLKFKNVFKYSTSKLIDDIITNLKSVRLELTALYDLVTKIASVIFIIALKKP